MKRESIYERRESAGRMEVILLVASVAGAVAALFVLLRYGLVLGVIALMPSVIALGLSRLFDLVSELFACVGRIEEDTRSRRELDDRNRP